MAKKIRIVPNRKGFESILTGAGVTRDLEARGRRVTSAAGAGFEASTFRMNYGGSPRSGVVVRARTAAARRAEAERKALTRSIDAARG